MFRLQVQVGYSTGKPYPIINAPKRKPVLPSTAQTRNSTGLKICTHIVFTLTGDQKVFSQPSQYCKSLYQTHAIHGFYASVIYSLCNCTHLQGHCTRLLLCTPLKAQLVLSTCNLLILFTILNVHVPCKNKDTNFEALSSQ